MPKPWPNRWAQVSSCPTRFVTASSERAICDCGGWTKRAGNVSPVDGLLWEVTILPVRERFFDFIFLTPSGRQPRVDLVPPLAENDLPVGANLELNTCSVKLILTIVQRRYDFVNHPKDFFIWSSEELAFGAKPTVI